MKEFKHSLKNILFYQLLLWCIFLLFEETSLNDNFGGYIPLFITCVVAFCILLYYLTDLKKYTKDNKLNLKKYSIISSIIMIISSIIICSFFMILIDNNLLHVCNSGWICLLNGIEYLFLGVFLGLVPLIGFILFGIYYLIKYIIKN